MGELSETPPARTRRKWKRTATEIRFDQMREVASLKWEGRLTDRQIAERIGKSVKTLGRWLSSEAFKNIYTQVGQDYDRQYTGEIRSLLTLALTRVREFLEDPKATKTRPHVLAEFTTLLNTTYKELRTPEEDEDDDRRKLREYLEELNRRKVVAEVPVLPALPDGLGEDVVEGDVTEVGDDGVEGDDVTWGRVYDSYEGDV